MKILRIASILGILAFAGSVYAATPSATSSANSTTITTPTMGQIENLKERLATKVAELQQVQKKAIVGTVKDISVASISVATQTSDVKIELTDNIGVFQTIKGKRTTLTTNDISKDDMVVVFGDYDATLDLLKAKVIVIQDPLPTRTSGTITDIDRKNYTVTIQSTEGPVYTVDIWNTTAMFIGDHQNGITKGGFSKVQIGETVFVVGTPEPKKDNYISAVRMLDIGFTNEAPTPTESQSQASGSASKATPTPTPKPTKVSTPTPTPAQ